MSDYQVLVKGEAKKFFERNWKEYDGDVGEHGGKSGKPNFSRWLDHTARLNPVITDIVGKWTHKDFLWVQHSSRNWNPKGGDPRSTAYGTLYLDVLHEVKKLSKKTP